MPLNGCIANVANTNIHNIIYLVVFLHDTIRANSATLFGEYFIKNIDNKMVIIRNKFARFCGTVKKKGIEKTRNVKVDTKDVFWLKLNPLVKVE